VRRLLTALLLFPLLVLGGCDTGSPDDSETPEVITSDLAEVEVTGDADEKPTVSWDGKFEAESTGRRLLSEGDGAVVAIGQKVSINYLGVNGRDGMEFDTSFGNPEPASFVLEPGSVIPGFATGLDGVAVGSRVLVGITPEDGYGEAGKPEAGIEGTDTLLFVIDVLGVKDVLNRATGKAVPPMPGLPTVTLDKATGAPTVKVPGGPPPTKLIIQPLIVGAGAKTAAGQSLTVQYHLVNWADNKVIESSWEKGTPAPLQIGSGSIIPGLDAGLTDQTIGSQILLVVPPGEETQGSAEGKDTIVFVVDILDAQ
jgi:peptidylprolyl isomerase